MKNKKKLIAVFGFLFLLLSTVLTAVYLQSRTTMNTQSNAQGQIVITDPPLSGQSNLQMRTFRVISLTPTPTSIPTPRPTRVPLTSAPAAAVPQPVGPVPVTTPAIGGPSASAMYYCIDDQDPDMCDDNSSHLVPKGVGGIAGTCGTVMENTHKLVEALPQYMKGLRNSLTKAVATTCGTTGPASGYISTFFVIDAYNLSGFSELSKTNPSHVSPSGLHTWWQSAPGYKYIAYSPTVVQQYGTGQIDLTGCVMFLQTSSSYHIGIVNELELFTSNGDGVISILQAGTRMYIDRFPVAGWSIANTSTNQTSTSGVVGFGCKQ